MTNLWTTPLRATRVLQKDALLNGRRVWYRLGLSGVLSIFSPDPSFMPGDDMMRSVVSAIQTAHMEQLAKGEPGLLTLADYVMQETG